MACHLACRSLYGDPRGGRAIEGETLRVVASSRPRRVPLARRRVRSSPAQAVERSRALFGRLWRRVPVYEREAQPPGARCDGPALIVEHHGATVVEPGWVARLEPSGALRLAQERGR